jgi:hypothetical protein
MTAVLHSASPALHSGRLGPKMVDNSDVPPSEGGIDLSMKDQANPRMEGDRTVRRFFFEHVVNSVLAEPFNDVGFTTNYACSMSWVRGREA